MNIHFEDMGPEDVVNGVKEKLGGRKLGDLLTFELAGDDIKVTIKKMGTSVLEFEHTNSGSGHNWRLSKEKIALAHKAFRGEVFDKLTKVIESLGGDVR